MTAIAIVGALLASVAASFLETSPRELANQFKKAQKLLVMGDFDSSMDMYHGLMETPGSPLLRAHRVKVEVGEERLLLKVAAAYQIASSYRRRAEEKLAAYEDSAEVPQLEDLRTAATYYGRLVDDPTTPHTLRERAAFQVGSCYFKNKDYPEAADGFDRFVRQFPDSDYVIQARYHTAWARFYEEDWAQAAGRFLDVFELEPDTDRGLRALFQRGVAQERLEQWHAGIRSFEQITQQYDTAAFGMERRREELIRALRENMPITRRELIGKAHLRVGDGYRRLDSLDQAISWYRMTVRRFPSDGPLLKNAYLRLAEIHGDEGRVAEALAAYRRALEEVKEPFFRAQVQAEMMGLAFEAGLYLESARAHRLYITAFAEHADDVGVTVAQAHLRLAESLRHAAKAAADRVAQDSLNFEALAAYRELRQVVGEDTLAAEALLGLGLCLQSLDSLDAAAATYRNLTDEYPGMRAANWGQLQLARLYETQRQATPALDAYEELLEAQDDEVRHIARVELALLADRLGRRERALDLLRSIPPASLEFGRAQVALVRIYTAEKRWRLARAVIDKGLEQATNPAIRAELMYARAELAFQNEEFVAALQLLADVDSTLLVEPFFQDRLYVRGTSQFRTGNYARAVDDLHAYLSTTSTKSMRQATIQVIGLCLVELQGPESAVERMEEWRAAAASAEARVEWQLGQARIWYSGGEHQRALELVENLEVPNDRLQQQALLIRAETLVALNEWGAAVGVLSEIESSALRRADRQHRRYLLGITTMNAGAFDVAVDHFRALLALGPDDERVRQAHKYLGQSLYTLGRHREAAAAFLQLTNRFPGHPDAYEVAFLAGDNFYAVEEFDQALKAYGLVTRGPRQAEAALARAWCHLELQQPGRLLADLEAVQQTFPSSRQAPEAAMMLGDYHYSVEDYAATRQAYHRLVERYPTSTEAARVRRLLVDLADLEADLLYQAAMATFELNDLDRARDLLEAVVERYPNTLSEMAARCNLGVCYERQGKWSDAVEIYESVLGTGDPDSHYTEMVNFAREHRDWITEYRL